MVRQIYFVCRRRVSCCGLQLVSREILIVKIQKKMANPFFTTAFCLMRNDHSVVGQPSLARGMVSLL